MSGNLTEETITEEVQRTFDTSTDERFRQLFVSLVQHLHDFAREWRLTGDEWFAAIDFLERVGKISSPTRQEYVLLSDILGLSVLVDKINSHHGPSVTDSTVIGPFFVEGRPTAGNGDDISDGIVGTPMFVTGRVVDEQGRPVVGAHVDTWHSDGEGFYDVRRLEKLHGQFAMRAVLTTDDDGRFWYRSITPRYYPVPTDGPCGQILRAANRAIMRPQHVHFWDRHHAEGYQPLISANIPARRSLHRPRRGLRGPEFAASRFRAPRAGRRPGRNDSRGAFRDSGLDFHPRQPGRNTRSQTDVAQKLGRADRGSRTGWHLRRCLPRPAPADFEPAGQEGEEGRHRTAAEPTFGRYAEIPLDQMTPQQREGSDRVVESRGEAPGPYIFIQNPALMHVVVPVGVYFNNGHSSLSGAEREIAVNLINGHWLAAYSNHERRDHWRRGRPAAGQGRSAHCRTADVIRRPAATGDLRPDPGVDRSPRCTYGSVPARRGPTGRCWRHRSDDAPRLLHDGVADAGGLQRSRRRRRLEAVTVTTQVDQTQVGMQ